jgi:DNA-binding transcriptional MerR regulator
MSKTYTPAEVCERFDIAKSTLYRWEDEGHIPAPNRNLRGGRQYTEEDIEAIGRFVQMRRHRKRYAQALTEGNDNARSELERLGEQNALFKFVNLHDVTGLAELREYVPLQPETILQLLRTAIEQHDPRDSQFWKIIDVVCATSRVEDR